MALRSIGLVGHGRMGAALSVRLREAGYRVVGPTGRGDEVPRAEAILLCVPDAEIGAAAAAVAGAARFVGHTSGATPLAALEPAGGEPFGVHPLQTVTATGGDFAGCGCAIAGGTPAALRVAREIAAALGTEPFEIDDAERASYHASASIASNFLVTLEAAAETVAGDAGIGPEQARRLLGPLVQSTVRNWIAFGPERALTGPVARGDEGTVALQRAAVEDRHPELLPLFDVLAENTRALARGVAR